MGPALGIDKSMPRRLWGASPKIDYGKTTNDFALEGFTPIGPADSALVLASLKPPGPDSDAESNTSNE